MIKTISKITQETINTYEGFVQSENPDKEGIFYRVTCIAGMWNCSCEAYKYQGGETCKHIEKVVNSRYCMEQENNKSTMNRKKYYEIKERSSGIPLHAARRFLSKYGDAAVSLVNKSAVISIVMRHAFMVSDGRPVPPEGRNETGADSHRLP